MGRVRDEEDQERDDDDAASDPESALMKPATSPISASFTRVS